MSIGQPNSLDFSCLCAQQMHWLTRQPPKQRKLSVQQVLVPRL